MRWYAISGSVRRTVTMIGATIRTTIPPAKASIAATLLAGHRPLDAQPTLVRATPQGRTALDTKTTAPRRRDGARTRRPTRLEASRGERTAAAARGVRRRRRAPPPCARR